MATDYNDFCRQSGCSEYIEWDYYFDNESQPYPCVSCQKVGQSYVIDKYPDDCPFIDEIKKIELPIDNPQPQEKVMSQPTTSREGDVKGCLTYKNLIKGCLYSGGLNKLRMFSSGGFRLAPEV